MNMMKSVQAVYIVVDAETVTNNQNFEILITIHCLFKPFL